MSNPVHFIKYVPTYIVHASSKTNPKYKFCAFFGVFMTEYIYI